MSKLAQSIRAHADKLENGQYAWQRTPSGYCHCTREETKEIAKRMRKTADRMQARFLIKLYS